MTRLWLFYSPPASVSVLVVVRVAVSWSICAFTPRFTPAIFCGHKGHTPVRRPEPTPPPPRRHFCYTSPIQSNYSSTMSDSEQYHIENADAGASATIPMEAGQIKKGGYVFGCRGEGERRGAGCGGREWGLCVVLVPRCWWRREMTRIDVLLSVAFDIVFDILSMSHHSPELG
jgi:hypothetical protein